MAGERQHYIPRFVLKGFGRLDGQRTITWLYRRGGDPVATSVGNVGVERRFYGDPGASSLDEKITDEERQKFVPLIDRLRANSSVRDAEAPAVVELVIHLSIRSKHVRETFSEATAQLHSKLRERASDPSELAKIVVEHLRDNPDALRESVRKAFKNHEGREPGEGELDAAVERLRPVFQSEAEMEAAVPGVSSSLAADMGLFMDELEERHPAMTKKGHVDSLDEYNPGEGARHERYLGFEWSVRNTDERLILGDVGALALLRDGSISRLLVDPDETVAVVLPISDHQLLVGAETPIEIDVERFNRASAELSWDWFIASEHSAREDAYYDLLGTRRSLASEETIRAWIWESGWRQPG